MPLHWELLLLEVLPSFRKWKLCFLYLLFHVVLIGSIFPQSNSAVSIFEKLYVIQTEYFDIIFPKSSEQSAQHVALHADSLYRKAADLLYVENLVRIPVVITQKTDELNAYFTLVPYSRIVLYDTPPQGNLDVFDDTILSVFYHELIHAVSLKNNIKNNIFLDFFPPFFTSVDMPPSMSEGVAVLAESMDGFGRLNSSESMHVVRQAKIEQKFPDWKDIAGSYSLYTDGSLPYIFGGAFMDYMYVTHGSQKLADFWTESSKINLTTYVQAFKKIYGLSIDQAWTKFEASVVVPPLDESPINFFNNTKNQHDYLNIASSIDGIAWQDLYSNVVYYVPHNKDVPDAKALFTTDLKARLSFSKDGRYLTVSGTTGFQSAKNSSKVYDMNTNRFVHTQEGLRDSIIVQFSQEDSESASFKGLHFGLVGIETQGQVSSLVAYDFLSDTTSHPLFKVSFDYGTIVLNPVDVGNGKIIALIKKHGTWEFFVYDYTTGIKKVFSPISEVSPSDIDSLHAGDSMLYMSLAMNANKQTSLAYISLEDFMSDTITINVEQTQRSGGVFSPVVIPSTTTCETIAYISRFYEHRALSTMKNHSENTYTLEFTSKTDEKETESEHILYATAPYNPFDYMFNGMFIPFIGSANLIPFDTNISTGFSLGASAYFLDPAERLLLGGGTGYDVLRESFTATLSSVFTEGYFTLNTEGYIELSQSSVQTGAAHFLASVSIPLVSDYNRLTFANSLMYFYQQTTNDFLFEGSTLENAFTLAFSRARKTSESYYSMLGFSILNQVQIQKYFGSDIRMSNEILYGDIIKVSAYLPWLLPFNNPSKFTVNFPFTLSMSKYFNFDASWGAEANVVLFSYDIQSSLSYLFFIQRITLDGGGTYTLFNDNTFDVRVLASVYVTSALNFSLATGYPIDIGMSFEWNPRVKGNEAIEVGLKFDLNL